VAEFDFEGLFSESSESGNPWDEAEDGELGGRFQEQLFSWAMVNYQLKCESVFSTSSHH